jgi:hypothetical protein
MLKIKLSPLVFAVLACLSMHAGAANSANDAVNEPLRWGVHAGINKVNEVTDAPLGVYADEAGLGGTLSFNVLYRFSSRFSLHTGVGLDYRYFGSEKQFGSLETENVVCLVGSPCGDDGGIESWSGYNKDYLLYLEIPLLVQFHIPDVLYFEVGPVFDFKLMRKMDYFEPIFFPEDRCQEDRVAGAGVSVGFGHVFSSGLFIDAHFSFQLTDLVSIDKSCSNYTVTVWKTYLDRETGEAITEKDYDYIEKIEVGSYFLLSKIQLGIGYWF